MESSWLRAKTTRAITPSTKITSASPTHAGYSLMNSKYPLPSEYQKHISSEESTSTYCASTMSNNSSNSNPNSLNTHTALLSSSLKALRLGGSQGSQFKVSDLIRCNNNPQDQQ